MTSRSQLKDADPSQAVAEAIERLVYGPSPSKGSKPAASQQKILAFKKILVGIDDSSSSADAMHWAGRLGKIYEGTIDAVAVATISASVDYYAPLLLQYQNLEESLARKSLAQAHAALLEYDRPVVSELRSGEPWLVLRDVAHARSSDLVVVGSHGRGRAKRMLLGSVSNSLRTHIKTNLLIARNRPPARRILVAVDGSAPSIRAGAVAVHLARQWPSTVKIVHVLPSLAFYPDGPPADALQRAFDELALPSWRDPELFFEIAYGSPGPKILEMAEDFGADLIVMGTHGKGAVKGAIVGSVSSHVAHGTKASLLLMQ
jgi:nucleotide-binding universal stress UspA family protein